MAVTPFKSSDNFNMAGFNEKIAEANNELEPVTIFEQDINYSGPVRDGEAVVCTIPENTDFSVLLERRNLILEVTINKIAQIKNDNTYAVTLFLNSPFTRDASQPFYHNIGNIYNMLESQQLSNLELKNTFREAYSGVSVALNDSNTIYQVSFYGLNEGIFRSNSICKLDSLLTLYSNRNLIISCKQQNTSTFATCEVANLQGKLKLIAQ